MKTIRIFVALFALGLASISLAQGPGIPAPMTGINAYLPIDQVIATLTDMSAGQNRHKLEVPKKAKNVVKGTESKLGKIEKKHHLSKVGKAFKSLKKGFSHVIKKLHLPGLHHGSNKAAEKAKEREQVAQKKMAQVHKIKG